MADVPKDIMEAARECCAGFFTGHRELYVEDVARAMVALIERERRTAQGVTWQPIETAPKDGTRILAVHENGGDITITWFGKTSHVPLYGWCEGEVDDIDLWHPTHWQPLPAAPSLSTSAGGEER